MRDDEAWEAFCEQLGGTEWVSFIQPPPTPRRSAEQVVRYLTRYLTGGPISDRRIVAADAWEVTFLARCKQLLGQAETDAYDEDALSSDDALPSPNAPLVGEESDEAKLPRCPHCEKRALRLVDESPKPSWSVALDHLDPRCPDWYAELDFQEHCRYLMEAYGVDYEDCYLETQVESAKSPPPPIQLYFPGMCPARDFLIESF